MNQFRLNRRSLNIDINFRVFELRKQIYRDVEDVINKLKSEDSFSFFIKKKGDDFSINDYFEKFRESLDNSKYLFSKSLYNDLERLGFFLDNGISLEIKIQELKEEHPDNWTVDLTKRLQDLSDQKKETLNCILDFNVDQFVSYLNISNFHKDFVSEGLKGNWIIWNEVIKKLSKFNLIILRKIQNKKPLSLEPNQHTNKNQVKIET